MIKYLITIVIVYYIYKFFIKVNALDRAEQDRRAQIRNPPPATPQEKRNNQDDYIDYEEVE